MKATTKGKLGAGIGGAIGLIVGIAFAVMTANSGGDAKAVIITGLMMGLFLVVIGIIAGFGYAFGLKLGVKWCGKAMGVAGATSIIAILFSKDRRNGFIVSLLIFTFVFSFTIGIAYLPGIFMGIRQIKEEARAN